MLGSLPPQAVHGLALLDQALHARANAGSVCVEALFHIVGAQHDDEQVDDFMALEQGIGHAQSIHGLVDGIYKNGGAARKALFGYQILVAQSSLQAAGPALVLVEADAAIGVILGVGTITVGVGIAQAENMWFSSQYTPLIVQMIRLRRAAGGSNRLRLPYRHHCAVGRRGSPAPRQRRA